MTLSSHGDRAAISWGEGRVRGGLGTPQGLGWGHVEGERALRHRVGNEGGSRTRTWVWCWGTSSGQGENWGAVTAWPCPKSPIG